MKLSVPLQLIAAFLARGRKAETCESERTCYRRYSGTRGGDSSNSCPCESVHVGPDFLVHDLACVVANKLVSTHDQYSCSFCRDCVWLGKIRLP
jgi:hypothetical protein